MKVRRYRAGIYARLSADHDERKNESVEVQIEIARKYVEEFNLKNTEEIIDIIDCYTDLGKTGSNFEREGFLRLLQDIRHGEINCVIVKDDCVIIELNAESLIKCGFCAVSSIF